MTVINVMAVAHNMAKAQVVGQPSRSYAEVLREWLRHFHKVAKQAAKLDAKYFVTYGIDPGKTASVDIRTLPEFSAARDMVKNPVNSWAIRGIVKTSSATFKHSSTGFHRDPLIDELDQWVNFASSYIELCLLLDIDSNLYRLTK